MRADKGNAGDGLWGVRKGKSCWAPFSSNPALLCLVKDYQGPNHCCAVSTALRQQPQPGLFPFPSCPKAVTHPHTMGVLYQRLPA